VFILVCLFVQKGGRVRAVSGGRLRFSSIVPSSEKARHRCLDDAASTHIAPQLRSSANGFVRKTNNKTGVGYDALVERSFSMRAIFLRGAIKLACETKYTHLVQTPEGRA
jgi:hypothetical protein